MIMSKRILSDELITQVNEKCNMDKTVEESRLMLSELLLKAGSGYYNSATEEEWMNQFKLLRKDRTCNKLGYRFLCSMFYSHSNRRPPGYNLMKKYRIPI